MSYHNEGFVKEKDGVVAPKGFHYMPNGKLMSDADHIAIHGYIDKKITSFNINTKDINYLGETRSFTVSGDKGAVFSLEIHDDAAGSPTLAPSYYNFNTNTWSSLKTGLYNIELIGSYTFSITFPAIEFTDATCDYNNDPTIAHDDDDGKIVAGMTVTGTGIPDGATVSSVTSDTAFELSASTTGGAVTNGTLTFAGIKKYTIDLLAKTADNVKTKHAAYSEVKNLDNSVNINKSTGSNSDLLRKIIYQDVKKNLYLSLIAPGLTTVSTDVVDGVVSSSNRIIVDELATTLSNMALGDKVTGTGVSAASHVLITKINPDNDNTKEIEVNQSISVEDDVVLTVTPVFAGMTPNGVVSTTGQQAFEISSGGNLKKTFSITCTALAGRTLSVSRLPTVSDLCVYKTVTFGSAALAIPGEDVSGSTYYRWPITNIAKLQEGMVLDPARRSTGINTTTPATISKYLTTISSSKIRDRRYYTDIEPTTINDVSVGGVDNYGNNITAVDRNGVVTAQAGNITFNVQQADALKSDAGVRIFAYGHDNIKSLTGAQVTLSNIVITPTQVSTTTTGAVDNSVTIPVTEAGNISTASTIRGVGITASAANPTVSLKSAATGGANLTASSAQTLESGQTLFFDNASNILTITGTIELLNMDISDTTLYLDVEKFINAS
tara:strand:- start:72 stop:2069 length:1998 start_codon:yes stop_codon:yes gene_type:complete